MWRTPKNDFADLDISVEFNEDDLNDPELLAELARMTMDDQPPKPKRKDPQPIKATEPIVEIDAILAEIPKDEEVHVEVTEEDLVNPELLAELAAVTGEPVHLDDVIEAKSSIEISVKTKNVVVAPIPDIQPTTPTTPSVDIEIPKESVSTYDESSLELKLESTNVEQLKQLLQLEKVQALNKKRAGERKGAMDHLKASKRIQARIDELSAKIPSQPNTPSSTTKETPPIMADSVPVESVHVIMDETLIMYEERIVEYKKAAVSHKNHPKGKEFLLIAKSIEKELELRKGGGSTPGYVLPAAVAQSSVTSPMVQAPQTITTPPEQAISTTPEPPTTTQTETELVNHLSTRIQTQMATCTKLAAQYFTANQKEKALEYHKKKKSLAQDLDTLKSIQSSHIPFRFVQEEIEYTIAQTHQDVPLDEICIEIVSGKDLYVKDVPDLETLVIFDFGWPSNASGALAQGKGETSIQKGSDPNYKYFTNIKIERTKTFQRFLERKKVSFEVYYITKALFGIMARRLLLGKASVKLDDLLSKREIHQMVPIMDAQNPRKAVGGNIEILLRMRAPLLKPDLLTTKESWVKLIFGESAGPVIIENPKVSPSPKQHRNDAAPQDKPVSPKPPSKPVSPQTSQQEIPDDDDLEEQFNNPDNIGSNQVLEHEHALIVQQLANAKGSTAEDLMHLKQGYEIKMQMLVTSIQLGKLDLPTYISQVKQQIVDTKQKALEFKKRGKLELAKKALVRVKLMTAEVNEVEQSS